jgi:hypothetical protein
MTRMISAELLKLRHSRAVWLGAAVTVIGIPVAVLLMTFVVGSHRVGGQERSSITAQFLLGPGLLAATLVGIAAGTADRTSGVLRSLVSTGRPRAQLFWVRVPAVLVAVTAIALAAWLVTCAIGAALHVHTTPVDVHWALTRLPSLLLASAVMGLAALGACSAGLSGPIVLGLVLTLVLGVLPGLAVIDTTPEWLLALMPPVAVVDVVGGKAVVNVEALPVGLAAAGLAAWVVVSLGAGLAHMVRADV